MHSLTSWDSAESREFNRAESHELHRLPESSTGFSSLLCRKQCNDLVNRFRGMQRSHCVGEIQKARGVLQILDVAVPRTAQGLSLIELVGFVGLRH